MPLKTTISLLSAPALAAAAIALGANSVTTVQAGSHPAPAYHVDVLGLGRTSEGTVMATLREWRIPGRAMVNIATDPDRDSVDAVRGEFAPGDAFVAATPCDSNSAPPTCSDSPPLPTNFLGQLNMWTGHVARVGLRGVSLEPKGLLFVAAQT